MELNRDFLSTGVSTVLSPKMTILERFGTVETVPEQCLEKCVDRVLPTFSAGGFRDAAQKRNRIGTIWVHCNIVPEQLYVKCAQRVLP